MGKERNPSAVVTVLQIALPVLGTVAVAYFGYLGLKLQVEAPIRATQTAEVKQTEVAKILGGTPADIAATTTPIPSVEVSPTSQPVETPIGSPDLIQPATSSPVATNTSSQSISIPINDMDPARFMQHYFLLVNNRQYQDAWSKLSARFKENFQNKGGDFDSYVAFWDTVDRVELIRSEIRSVNNTEAYIDTEINYHYKAGHTSTAHTTYKLVKSSSNTSWLIDPN